MDGGGLKMVLDPEKPSVEQVERALGTAEFLTLDTSGAKRVRVERAILSQEPRGALQGEGIFGQRSERQ